MCQFVFTFLHSRDDKLVEEKPDHVVRTNMNRSNESCVRESWWNRSKENCAGENIRAICNFGVNDLAELRGSPSAESSEAEGSGETAAAAGENKCFFANKFNLAVDPVAAMCQYRHLLELNKR